MARKDTSPTSGLAIIAAHEAGHGVIWKVGGFHVAHITLTAGWFGNATGRTRVQGDSSTRTQLDAGAAGMLAGEQAVAEWLVRHAGFSTGKAQRWGTRSAQNDLAEFRDLARLHRHLTLARVRAAARTAVRTHWDRIEHAATRLLATGRVAGSSL
jgi:hypothetical protein